LLHDLAEGLHPGKLVERPAVVIATDEPLHGEALDILRTQLDRLRSRCKVWAEDLEHSAKRAAEAEKQLAAANAQLHSIETAIEALGGKIEQ
jgi:chromosome segregation ATPase